MEPFVKGKVKLKTRPKQIKMDPLTPTQIKIARKLKVPLKEYLDLGRVRWG